jgi:phage baseplate assembly protein gpV
MLWTGTRAPTVLLEAMVTGQKGISETSNSGTDMVVKDVVIPPFVLTRTEVVIAGQVTVAGTSSWNGGRIKVQGATQDISGDSSSQMSGET